jgi:integrase
MPENRLALIVSLTTGLRIDDVLHLKTAKIQKQRFTVKEMKTGKTRRVNLSVGLWQELLQVAGRIYVFEHRTDPKRCRTRQAVNKDLKRACELFRIKGVNLSPHSARKIYAVNNYRRTCDLDKVRALLNHSEKQTEVTMLYAMADVLTERRTARKKVHYPS